MEQWQVRTGMLVSEDGLERLSSSTVAVIGLGGVGAFAAEMVVRAGVGKVLILDSDNISLTNINRQLLALHSTVGQMKADILAARLKDINPSVELVVRHDYLTESNVADVLCGLKIGYLIDAIDTLGPKLALIHHCVKVAGIPLVSSMGSGAKFDASKVRIADISKSFNCPLAYMVRKKLRRMGIEKGFKAVFSEELPIREAIVPMSEQEMSEVSNKKSQVGTISYLPAVFGCMCAQAALTALLDRQ